MHTYHNELGDMQVHIVEGEGIGILVSPQFVLQGPDFLLEGQVLKLKGAHNVGVLLASATKTGQLVKTQEVEAWD